MPDLAWREQIREAVFRDLAFKGALERCRVGHERVDLHPGGVVVRPAQQTSGPVSAANCACMAATTEAASAALPGRMR